MKKILFGILITFSFQANAQQLPDCMPREQFVGLLPQILSSPQKANVIVAQNNLVLIFEEWFNDSKWVRTITNKNSNVTCIASSGSRV